MDDRIDAFEATLERLLKPRVDPEVIAELKAEVRTHYEAALELFADESDPQERAIELLGTPETMALGYVRENPRCSPTAVAAALVVAAFFFIQPILYLVSSKGTYLIEMPLIWLNVSLCFLAAAIWCRRLIIKQLAGCMLLLIAATTFWAAPRYVWIPNQHRDHDLLGLSHTLATRESVVDYIQSDLEHVLMERPRIRAILEGTAKSYGGAIRSTDLRPEDSMEGRFLTPRLFARDETGPGPTRPYQSLLQTDFAKAKHEWTTWERDVWPSIEASYLQRAQLLDEMRQIIRHGIKGSLLPVLIHAAAWGTIAFTYLLLINQLGVWIGRLFSALIGPHRGTA